MTLPLKYVILGMILLLDVMVVLYFFSETPDAPKKQGAVQQPVSAPPVQHPVLPPQQIQQQNAETTCREREAWYKDQFNVIWPEKLRQSFLSGDERAAGLLHTDLRLFYAQWENHVSWCRHMAPTWEPTLGLLTVDRAFRGDCNSRVWRYYFQFEALERLKTRPAQDAYIQQNWGKDGVTTLPQFLSRFSSLKERCRQDVKSGWKVPYEDSPILRAVSR